MTVARPMTVPGPTTATNSMRYSFGGVAIKSACLKERMHMILHHLMTL